MVAKLASRSVLVVASVVEVVVGKGGNGDSGGNKGGNGDSGGSKSSDVTFSGRALQWRISGRESRGSPAASIGKPANVMTHQFNNSPF